MRRRRYVKAAGAAVTGSVLAGCAASSSEDPTDGDDMSGDGANETGTGTLSTSVTDQPVDIDDFESCVITIEGIWVKPEGGGDPDGEDDESVEFDEDEPDDEGSDTGGTTEEADEPETGEQEDTEDNGSGVDEEPDDRADEGEGRQYIGFEKPQKADLVQLQGANTQLVDETELAVGAYRYLQLNIGGVEAVLVEGQMAEIDTPGNAPLQFKQSFEIRADERTCFVADFAPVRRGQGDRYLLRPVATGTQVLYGNEGYDPDGSNADNETDEDGETGDDSEDRANGDESSQRSNDSSENDGN